MIGQEALLQFIQKQVDTETFPRFSIIVGKKGSGRRTLVHKIFTTFGGVFTDIGTSIADIRQMISEAYRLNGVNSVYLIADADEMSLQAQNALLKVAEEPPNNAYIIMTVEDEQNVLSTIASRGNVYMMENYTKDEIRQYTKNNYNVDSDSLNIICQYCETIGEIKTLMEYDPNKFNEFILLVVDKVSKVSLANALKIADKLSLKDEADKYSLKIFYTAFLAICGQRMTEDRKYLEWCLITTNALRKLYTIRGINKQMLFDNWLFDIREWDDGC